MFLLFLIHKFLIHTASLMSLPFSSDCLSITLTFSHSRLQDDEFRCRSNVVFRLAVADNARPGEPDARVSQVDRARRRHRPDVDRVAQHGHGRQQGADAGQQRANLTHSVDASAL